jgi:hypothetical protein
MPRRAASHGLDSPCREDAHLEEQSAITPAPDIGCAMIAFTVADQPIGRARASRREQQIEIANGSKSPK